MSTPDELIATLERILAGSRDEIEIAKLRQWLKVSGSKLQFVSQDGKFNTNVGQIIGGEVYIGDRIYHGVDAEAIRGILRETLQSLQPNTQPTGIPANLPYSGVVQFVGRDAVISQLHQMLQQSHRVAVSAIAGMGGVGKTELALQYALKYQPTYPAGICWLSARGVDVGTQIVQFARSLLDLNPPEDVELIEQVKFCWRHWQSGEVLLVFDDVTDYAAIKPYLPPSTVPRFKVLITTRLRLGASVNQLELEVLDEAAALALLESLVGGDRIQPERDCTQQLCAQLGYLPLGLELVGRYLARQPDLSLAAMQQRLQEKRLAARALRQTEDDMTARSGVTAAFELSWDTLSESGKLLGCLLSLFAAAPIPWSLVEQCLAERDPEDLEEVRDNELLNLHLLQRTNPGTYRLHPLIRDFFQTKLAQSQDSDALKQRFCQAMAAVARQVPEGESPTQQEILAIAPTIPHMAEVATQLQDWLSDDDLINPYIGLGRFYQGQGVYAQAEPWYVQCCLVSTNRLGTDHLHLAESLNALAGLYWYQGRYSEAEPLFQRALAIRKQHLDADHPNVATSLNNLAELYRIQNRYSEAEPLHQRALAIREQHFGADHPDVAESLGNLAMLYHGQGRYSEAELLHEQALAIREQHFGADHPNVAISLNNLAMLYCSQGRYSKAESLLHRALAIDEQKLRSDHPDVAFSLNNLATLYRNQGRYREAEPLLHRALAINEQQLGVNHPDVVTNLYGLANLYANQGRYSEAEPLFLRALTIGEQLGGDHPNVALSLNNLAALYRDQGRYSEAEPLLQRALDVWKRTLGEAHPNVGRGLDNLGMLHAAQGHARVAEALYVEALGILEQSLGAEHPWTVRCRENLEQLRNRS